MRRLIALAATAVLAMSFNASADKVHSYPPDAEYVSPNENGEKLYSIWFRHDLVEHSESAAKRRRDILEIHKTPSTFAVGIGRKFAKWRGRSKRTTTSRQ